MPAFRLFSPLLFLTILTTSVLAAPPDGKVQWSTSPNAAAETARTSQRPVLMYFTTGYCGYCRKLEQNTWSNDSVSNLLTASFVPLKVDGEKNANLTRTLGVQGFPTVIVLSPQGKVLERVTGYLDANKMLAKLRPVAAQSAPGIVRLNGTSD